MQIVILSFMSQRMHIVHAPENCIILQKRIAHNYTQKSYTDTITQHMYSDIVHTITNGNHTQALKHHTMSHISRIQLHTHTDHPHTINNTHIITYGTNHTHAPNHYTRNHMNMDITYKHTTSIRTP